MNHIEVPEVTYYREVGYIPATGKVENMRLSLKDKHLHATYSELVTMEFSKHFSFNANKRTVESFSKLMMQAPKNRDPNDRFISTFEVQSVNDKKREIVVRTRGRDSAKHRSEFY